MSNEVEVEIAFGDLVAASEYHYLKSRRARRYLMHYGFPLLLLAITLPFGKGSLLAIILLDLVLVCGWIYSYPSFLRKRIRRALRKAIREGKNKSTSGRRTVSLLPEYLLQVGDFGESKTRWGFVDEVIGTDDFALIYTDGVPTCLVPRRSFSTQEAFDTFVREAESLRTRFART